MNAHSTQLPGSADAYFLARLPAAHQRPLFIITANAQDAERLTQEIAWFAPTLRVHRLPDWETLPYDHFSPHPDLISERLATLYQFAQGDFDIGIVPVTTAMTRLPPREYLGGRSFFLRVKSRLNQERLKTDLTQAGYAHVTQV
ncbi:MAG: transcription-repair coupling factor, partial [Betaproteobacteria bacterium]|nr:transcription-repair coupling factor [Betaproteobacteria bacterium]